MSPLERDRLPFESGKLRQETLDSSGDEMSRLGLVVDALQIREIVDPTGYIKNLAAPHAGRLLEIVAEHIDRLG